VNSDRIARAIIYACCTLKSASFSCTLDVEALIAVTSTTARSA
jgi:hypothetical protein